MNIGDNIKRLRKINGLTQSDLGKKLGITQSAIGQFEKGTSSLKIETIEKIAKALNVPISALLVGVDMDYNKFSHHKSKNAKEIQKRLAIIKFLDCLYDSASITKVKIYDKKTGNVNFNDEYVNILSNNLSFIIDNDIINCLLNIIQNICENIISINALNENEYLNKYYNSPNLLFDYCIEWLEIKSHTESKVNNENSKEWEQFKMEQEKIIESNSNQEEFIPIQLSKNPPAT